MPVRNFIPVKVSGKNVKGTTLAKYLTKVTARPSFTRLRAINQINRVH